MTTLEQLKALAGPEQTFTSETAPAHAGLDEVPESMEMEICNAIYDTITKEKYKTVLEVGTHYGCTTAWILLALQETQGSIHTIDVRGWERNVCDEVGLERTRLKKSIWPSIQEGDVLKHWYMDKKYTKLLPKKADFIVVDAAHNVDETTALVTLLSPLVRKGGQIVFHDSFSYRGAVGLPLVKFFAKPENENHWMTYDLPVGCGIFIAKRI